MGDIVNLRQVKKQRAKAEAAAEAAQNRALHGRTKGEKQGDALERERRRALLDGAKREDDPQSQ